MNIANLLESSEKTLEIAQLSLVRNGKNISSPISFDEISRIFINDGVIKEAFMINDDMIIDAPIYLL